MYDFITGIIKEKKTTSVVIKNNGLGYAVNIPISTYDQIGAIGDSCKLFLHLYVRENDLRLFGFYTAEEREIFESLIKVSNIGPKIAISILSGISVKSLIEAVAKQDIELLSSVPGIGKKSSQRIIIELKDSFERLIEEEVIGTEATKEERAIITDAENALISLGYNKISVKREIQKFLSKNKPTSSGEIVKTIIRQLYS
ncbi:MAG: Holliday junction branch migration protein RuvA [Candidatus Cloacimonadota bacterium]|nr:Holliday junction branch migration protein RuvA [Candidatus Cloacimonadota bacterium]